MLAKAVFADRTRYHHLNLKFFQYQLDQSVQPSHSLGKATEPALHSTYSFILVSSLLLNMSSSKSDPTRFTSTGPSASSYSSYQIRSTTQSASPSAFTSSRPLPTSHNRNSNAPPNETPKQKVERLRAQSRAAKAAAQYSPVDRIVDRGRLWADRAHRIVAVGLIGFSGTTSPSLPLSVTRQS